MEEISNTIVTVTEVTYPDLQSYLNYVYTTGVASFTYSFLNKVRQLYCGSQPTQRKDMNETNSATKQRESSYARRVGDALSININLDILGKMQNEQKKISGGGRQIEYHFMIAMSGNSISFPSGQIRK